MWGEAPTRLCRWDAGKGCLRRVKYIHFTKEDITDEKIVAYRKAIEEARPYPVRTVPILNIIQEEAAEYFNGIKSVEEVSRVVTNRVQLYLDERK